MKDENLLLKSMLRVEEIIYEMMTEEISMCYLDSKCVSGYQRERRIKEGLERMKSVPPLKFEFDRRDYIVRSTSMFHHLISTLSVNKYSMTLTERMLKDFGSYPYDLSYQRCIKKWLEDNSFSDMGIVNTYDDELMDGVFMHNVFLTNEDDYEKYVVIMTHNGADVRSGYSRPRIFVDADDVECLPDIPYGDYKMMCSGNPAHQFHLTKEKYDLDSRYVNDDYDLYEMWRESGLSYDEEVPLCPYPECESPMHMVPVETQPKLTELSMFSEGGIR